MLPGTDGLAYELRRLQDARDAAEPHRCAGGEFIQLHLWVPTVGLLNPLTTELKFTDGEPNGTCVLCGGIKCGALWLWF